MGKSWEGKRGTSVLDGKYYKMQDKKTSKEEKSKFTLIVWAFEITEGEGVEEK